MPPLPLSVMFGNFYLPLTMTTPSGSSSTTKPPPTSPHYWTKSNPRSLTLLQPTAISIRNACENPRRHKSIARLTLLVGGYLWCEFRRQNQTHRIRINSGRCHLDPQIQDTPVVRRFRQTCGAVRPHSARLRGGLRVGIFALIPWRHRESAKSMFQ